ncbi:hypothetical protein BJ986_000156 [Phycicoccus badiiscoriae]|uniref:Uncharacterized protein n=1 Tax=Pedococcus badiiscoriae TaxID=642776 RepID=A0A852WA00_9MICO|nr:hypothetical protein [Pedococcus badiiscoriae]NYG05669.1 hypothetical protein [Pedococcus badiiscoriae]
MTMWQRLLERFVPLVDDDVSSLDRRDGVGVSSESVVDLRGARDQAGPSRGSRTAYKGA